MDIKRLLYSVSLFLGARIARRGLVEELEWAGEHDILTGLLNRRGTDAAASRHLAAHPSEPYALALLDIDDFKIVNDLHGHSVGDEALRTLAQAMRHAFPLNAILGRNGGDELLIMLTGGNALDADRLLEDFSCEGFGFAYRGQHHRFTISIGFTTFPGQAEDLNQAYSQADAALYAVKLDGKHGVRRYSDDLKSQYRSQLGFTPRDIAENLPGAILVHRAGGDGEILFANDELVEMFECEDLADFMEFTGGSFKNMVHPDDGPHVYEEMTRQAKLDDIGSKVFVDYRIITKSGNVKEVADNGRLVEIDEVGKAFYVIILDRGERAGR